MFCRLFRARLVRGRLVRGSCRKRDSCEPKARLVRGRLVRGSCRRTETDYSLFTLFVLSDCCPGKSIGGAIDHRRGCKPPVQEHQQNKSLRFATVSLAATAADETSAYHSGLRYATVSLAAMAADETSAYQSGLRYATVSLAAMAADETSAYHYDLKVNVSYSVLTLRFSLSLPLSD